jgi:hypothetical protein
MSPLQDDCQHRIWKYQRCRDEAKAQGQALLARRWSRAMEDERKILEMIKRVEALEAKHEYERDDDGEGARVAVPHERTC